MKTAKEYWKERFGEYPQNDAEKLAVMMMAEYAEQRLLASSEAEKGEKCLPDIVMPFDPPTAQEKQAVEDYYCATPALGKCRVQCQECAHYEAGLPSIYGTKKPAAPDKGEDELSELDAAKMEMEEVINDYPKKDYSPQIIGKLSVEKSEGEEAEDKKYFHRFANENGDYTISYDLNGDDEQVIFHGGARITEHAAHALNEILDKYSSGDRGRKEWPSVEQAGIIAVGISEESKMSEYLSANEQAYFIAGFQECIKYINKANHGQKSKS